MKKPLNLKDPKCAREYLSTLVVDGMPVTDFYLDSGRVVSIYDMSDSQAVIYANEMYYNWFGKKDLSSRNTAKIYKDIH